MESGVAKSIQYIKSRVVRLLLPAVPPPVPHLSPSLVPTLSETEGRVINIRVLGNVALCQQSAGKSVTNTWPGKYLRGLVHR